MTMLTVLPSLLIMMTAFTRIMVVMAILRQTIGCNKRLPIKFCLTVVILTLFVMMPAFQKSMKPPQPYMQEKSRLWWRWKKNL